MHSTAMYAWAYMHYIFPTHMEVPRKHTPGVTHTCKCMCVCIRCSSALGLNMNHNLGIKENIPDYIRQQNTIIITHTIVSIHASCTYLHNHLLHTVYTTGIPFSCTVNLPLTISPPARTNISTYRPLANTSTGTPNLTYQDCQTVKSLQHTHLKPLLTVLILDSGDI